MAGGQTVQDHMYATGMHDVIPRSNCKKKNENTGSLIMSQWEAERTCIVVARQPVL